MLKSTFKVTPKNLLSMTIILIPLWWLLGIGSIVFHIITLLVLLGLLKGKGIDRELKIPSELIFLGIFILVYMFSIAINLSNIPFTRLLATLYNLSFWIEGFFIIMAIYNIPLEENDVLKIAKSFMIFGNICGMVSIAGIVLWFCGQKNFILYSPIYKFVPDYLRDSLVGNTLSFSIVAADYTSFGLLPRNSLFFGYAAALGMGMVVTIPMTLYYFKAIKKTSKSIIPISIQCFALLFSLSRIAIIGLLFSWIIVNYFVRRKTYSFIVKILLGVLIMMLLEIIYPSIFYRMVGFMEKFRGGSTDKRIYMYDESIRQTLENPFLGYGFKPKPKELGVPIASHSTFISIFYKTGAIGLSFLLLLWWNIYRTWRKAIEKIREDKLIYFARNLGVVFISGIIWQLTEDLDAPAIVAFFYFLIIGLLIKLKQLKSEMFLADAEKAQ